VSPASPFAATMPNSARCPRNALMRIDPGVSLPELTERTKFRRWNPKFAFFMENCRTRSWRALSRLLSPAPGWVANLGSLPLTGLFSRPPRASALDAF
jgi:hypothetical protein